MAAGQWEYVGNIPGGWVHGEAPPQGYTKGASSWGEMISDVEYEVEGYTRVGESEPSFWRRRVSKAWNERQTADPSWKAAKRVAEAEALAELQRSGLYSSMGIGLDPATGLQLGETGPQFNPNVPPPPVPLVQKREPATGGTTSFTDEALDLRANVTSQPPASVAQQIINSYADRSGIGSGSATRGGDSYLLATGGDSIPGGGGPTQAAPPIDVPEWAKSGQAAPSWDYTTDDTMWASPGGVVGLDINPIQKAADEQRQREAAAAGGRTPVSTRSYPEGDSWVTETTWDDGSKSWDKEPLAAAVAAGKTEAWRATQPAAAAAAAASQGAEGGLPPQRQGRNVPAIPMKEEVDKTGPITGTIEGDTFGVDKLRLSTGGTSLGGGNPNEMYRWYMEAKTSGYPEYMQLWEGMPADVINRYNIWKRTKIDEGWEFIGVNNDGSGEGGRLIPTGSRAAYQAEVANVEQASTAAAAVPGAAPGTPGVHDVGPYGSTRRDVEMGLTSQSRGIAQEETLRGAGLYAGNPFLDSMERELGRALNPYKFAQEAYQTLNPGGPDVPQYGDFLRGRLGGETGLGGFGTPEVLGNIVNPPSARWELMAEDIEKNPGWGFDVAAQTMGLGGQSFLRNALYNNQSRLQNQYQSQLSQGQVTDTTGADYYNWLQQQLGAA
tara:strand:+ start:9164 stop:11158 length:1995 start_codon:yes stop_codon:yes gene_type:complete